jgi:DNA-binding CsgD family transcriptional regulator
MNSGRYDSPSLREPDAGAPASRMAARMTYLTWEANFRGRLSAFEAVGRGALLLDRHGIVLEMNKAVKLGDGLVIRGGRLTATALGHQKLIAGFLAELLKLDEDLLEPKSAMLVLPRQSGARPIIVDGIRQPTAARSAQSATAALLLLTDLERSERPPSQLLCTLFGLTRTEAKLAVQLCSGKSLRAAAAGLLLTEGYARQRLKAIFQKTSTSRQAELMILLAKLSRP